VLCRALGSAGTAPEPGLYGPECVVLWGWRSFGCPAHKMEVEVLEAK